MILLINLKKGPTDDPKVCTSRSLPLANPAHPLSWEASSKNLAADWGVIAATLLGWLYRPQTRTSI